MKLSFSPKPFILFSIIPNHSSKPFFNWVFKMASVFVLSNFNLSPKSILFIILKLSFIDDFLITWDISSIAMTLLILKFTFIATSIRLNEDTSTMRYVIFPHSLIAWTISKNLTTPTIPLPIFLRPLINISIFIRNLNHFRIKLI